MINLDENMKLFKEVSTKSLESVGAFGQLNLQAWNELAEKQMEIVALATEASFESLNALTKTQDVPNLTDQQTIERIRYAKKTKDVSTERTLSYYQSR